MYYLCRAARLNRFFCWHFVGTRGDQTTLQSKVWSGQQRKLPSRSLQIQGHNRATATVPVQNTCNALDVDRPAGLIARRGSTGSRGDPRCQLPRPNMPADVWHCPFRRYIHTFGGDDMHHFGCCRFLYTPYLVLCILTLPFSYYT
jgi:hypothetical protein